MCFECPVGDHPWPLSSSLETLNLGKYLGEGPGPGGLSWQLLPLQGTHFLVPSSTSA